MKMPYRVLKSLTILCAENYICNMTKIKLQNFPIKSWYIKC